MAARLAASLCRHEPETTRTRSELEEAFLLLVRSVSLPPPGVNVRLGPYVVDFLWQEQRVVVETNGAASHDRRATRESDIRRDAWLAARGFRVLRFTWRQVTERPGEVLAALDAVLA
jgi:very-short-patch-repair endonuclease